MGRVIPCHSPPFSRKVVPPYAFEDALAKELLASANILMPREQLWTHFYLRDLQQLLFLTTRSLIIASYKKQKIQIATVLPWEHATDISKTRTGKEGTFIFCLFFAFPLSLLFFIFSSPSYLPFLHPHFGRHRNLYTSKWIETTPSHHQLGQPDC